ncbi:MAG: Ig-like domain-containing protein [Leucobacter sp.]
MARASRVGGAARRRQTPDPGRRSRLVTWIAGGVSVAVIATIAVVAAGYDARETPREEPSVWAVRSSGQYARVNTLTAEIDTVRQVEDPSGVLQFGAQSAVLSHGNGRVWTVDPTLPKDLGDSDAAGEKKSKKKDKDDADAQPVAGAAGDDDTPNAMRAPEGTRDMIVAGDSVLFRTDDGEVYLSRFGDVASGAEAGLSDPMLLDPFAEERAQQDDPDAEDAEEDALAFFADAAAIDADGRVAMFSAEAAELRWYDVGEGRFEGAEAVPEGIPAEDAQLAIVSGAWALFAPESGALWVEGVNGPIETGAAAEALLQASSTEEAGGDVLIADAEGLLRVEPRGSETRAERVAEADGAPTQPTQVGEQRYAAWLGAREGLLWSSSGGPIPLDLDPDTKMPGEPEPVIRSNGSSALVAEQRTGMMWTVPDGKLIPVEQWSLVDPPKERSGVVVVTDVTEQVPPVAVDDAFGVRAGEPASLPVLLNDYDPNRRDVLTIVPEGLAGGLPSEFGRVSMLPDGQSLVIDPEPKATGSASFTYRVTDGVNVSEPATVRLTAVDPGTSTAPEWCPVEGCQREWPSPELAPGGTLVLPVLEGWVDPEGDPIMLESATAAQASGEEQPVRAMVTADGRMAVRHADPNAPDSDVAVTVTVADARGEKTERDMTVQVRSNAKAEMVPLAGTVQIDQSMTFRPLSRIVGGSGSYELVDANVQSGHAGVVANVAAGTIEATAKRAGSTIVALTARDVGTDTEIAGVLRVTAVDGQPDLGLPPLRAFVRPLADTTVDVLDAVPGANARALTVRSAKVLDGELRADVLEHAQVRVSGATPDGAPGRIGAADIVVEEGAETVAGRLTVFQVPESGDTGAIAVADNITVRAGAIADIPVLDNDVSPPGQRLVLHPEIGGSGTKGELAFASGNTLRYLAPTKPGNYNLTYTTYGASTPEGSDVGQVRVTVIPREGNRDPQPRALTVRLAPGERSTVQVPLSGVDPDGDRVRLLGVSEPSDPQLSATLAPRSSAIQVEAAGNVKPGVQVMSYAVRDEFGGEAEGRLRVIVTDADGGARAPVAFSDYVRLVKGSKEAAVVQPLDNDIDPSGGKLQLVDVVPNVPGGENSEQYRELLSRLDASELKKWRVRVKGSDDLGTASYRYTVRSPESKSTSDGLIVVQVSARVGQQAPTVRDTVLSARDRVTLERGGVDVVTDRVHWASGDVSALQLSVWGSARDRFTADGTHISGTYRAEGDLVPFRLAGKDLTGAEVQSFGFLVVPPLDELRLTLKPGLQALRVDEGESVDASLADVVDLAAGDRAEFRVGRFQAQRGQASCEATSATTVRYSAGKEAPFTDTCTVSVKLTEQNAWTQLAVPVEIVPNEPVAELEPLTRTIAPGTSETVDLTEMVRWQGGREGNVGDLRFEVGSGGPNFSLDQGGSRITATANADAVPGREDTVIVRVLSGEGSQAALTLRVGEAARDTPRGGSVRLDCNVGSACQAQLIGAPGEYDPFQGKSGAGLELVSVEGGSCNVASFQASGNAVSVAWPSGGKGAGGQCTATFTVKDAQNRTGQGRIELDAKGVPRAPTGVTPVSADGSSVKLSVALSGEQSYPATTGVELVADGRAVGSCQMASSQATCTVTGLKPGDRRTYFARATNAAGESEQSANGAETWAYVTPTAPSIRVETVRWPENSNPDRGRVRAVIGESTAATRVLSVDGSETSIAGDGIYTLAAGSPHTFSVISADSSSMIPPGYTGKDGGRGEASTARVTPIGAPTAGSAELRLSGSRNTDWEIATSGFDSRGGDSLSYTYAISGYSGSRSSGSGLEEHEVYRGSVSAANSYGVTGTVSTNEVTTGKRLPTLTGTYRVLRQATPDASGLAVWNPGEISWSPSPTGTLSDTSISIAAPERYDVVQCARGGRNCSEPGSVTPKSGSPRPFSLQRGAACIPLGAGNAPPTAAAIESSFTRNGDPGIGLLYQASGRDVIVKWSDTGNTAATFAGAICEPEPETPEPPDPGDPEEPGDPDDGGDPPSEP